jgi:type I restriction enzyme, S subunit
MGVLPEGWTKDAVGNRGEVQAGRQRSPGFTNGELTKYLRVANVYDGYIDTSDVLEMRFSRAERLRYLLQHGDVLLNEGQSVELVGRSAMYVGDPESCCFQNTLVRFRAKEGTDPAYALQRFRLCLYDGTFQNIATKTTSIAHLGVSRFAGLKLEWPPYREQSEIVRILDVWDRAISTARELLANCRRQRLSLLSKLLNTPASASEVSERERIGNHPPSVQSGIPSISPTPSGWRRVFLRDHLSEISRPVVLQSDQSYELVTVRRSRGGVASRGKLRGDEIKTLAQSMVRVDDFLISKRQIVHGACGIVPAELDGAVISNEYAVLRSDGEIDLSFLRYLSESIYFQQTCFHSSTGVHVEKMIFKTERWLSFPFNIPPLKEQRRIVQILEVAASEIESLQRQVETLRNEKLALMRALLTGRRRVRPSAVSEGAAA